MKRLLCSFLVIVSLLSMAACGQEPNTKANSVTFYYCRKDIQYGTSDSVISKETFDASNPQDPVFLLNLYLAGPKSDDLVSPFPEGTQLMTMSYSDTTANVILSEHLGQLTGMDLTIACACLTLTVMDLTGKETVNIQANRSLLDGAQFIIMDKNSLLLLDDLIPATD